MKNYFEITGVYAREVLDSRGNPTVEAEVYIKNGIFGRAIVPSGASTGIFEAVEKRDGDKERYMGKGVLEAVGKVNTVIRESLVGRNVLSQREIDMELIRLDGSENKENLGANSILAVSAACADCAAKALGISLFKYLGGVNAHVLPRPMMNILNGGAHADNNLDIQEFMIIPTSALSFKKGLEQCVCVYHSLKNVLKEKNLSTAVGDEGGFAPNLNSDEEAFDLLIEAIEKAGYKSGKDFMISVDAASSEWIKSDGEYHLPKSDKRLDSKQLCDYWEKIVNKYPIYSLEDPMGEEDWKGWEMITKVIGNKVKLVGDDLFVTNTKRLKKGIEGNIANTILVKINQIGTITEALDAVEMAHKSGYSAILSHRSGETEDTIISDIAVAVNCGLIKTGAPARTERVAKYNRLLRIEDELIFTAEF
ncbi:MAG: phosphopyruvate hydratase [Ruminococcaceae bacterium]|nr:phosphopyruvate hydratase [Oscillospiraceae bacterium]